MEVMTECHRGRIILTAMLAGMSTLMDRGRVTQWDITAHSYRFFGGIMTL